MLNRVFNILGLIVVITTCIGVYLNYSPVPLMDMWDGCLDFYVKVIDGDWHKWFAQHNEHRTVFSNILFFIDIHFFSGLNKFLLFFNILLMGSTAYVIYLLISNLFKDIASSSNIQKLLIAFGIIISFSWLQHENITWGFQSQFFAAYLFPLLSFFLLVYSKENNSNTAFVFAIISGIVSAGTMANGVIALPILFVLSLLLRNSFIKSLSVLIVSIIVLYLYFNNYTAPGGHGSLKETLLHNPKDFFKYLFMYLGGIFYYLTGKGGTLITQIFGVILLLTSLFFGYLYIFKRSLNSFYLVILGFLLFYGATAFGTAGGRTIFGVYQAITSRYMTPSLIAWSLIFIAYIHYFANRKKIQKIILNIIVVIAVLITLIQVKAFKYNDKDQFEKRVATLALEMRVNDEAYIKKIFPFIAWIRSMAEEPIKRDLSIFATSDIQNVRELIGTQYNKIELNNIDSNIVIKNSLQVDSSFYRVEGLLNISHKDNTKFFIIDSINTIVGYGLDKKEDKDTLYFVAYLKANNIKDLFIVYADSKIPLEVKDIKPFFLSEDLTINQNSQIKMVKNTMFENGTYDKRGINSVKIYGSYKDSDKDKGSIVIKLTKNDSILVKTGPTIGNQLIRIYTENEELYKGPYLSETWKKINFSKKLPEEFFIEITDNGTSHGEWIAIGVSNN